MAGNGWSPKDIRTSSTSVVAINTTDGEVGNTFSINAGGAAETLLIGIKLSGVAGTVTFRLQHAIGTDFADVTGKSVVGANGWNYIKLHHNVTADAALMPLLDVGRILVTSNGTGVATITNLVVLQPL